MMCVDWFCIDGVNTVVTSVILSIDAIVNRTIKSWNQLPGGLLASFPCKVNKFRKRVKNVVTSKGLQVGYECK